MKKLFILLTLTSMMLSAKFALSQTTFGINGGLAIPTGDMADAHKIGYGFGAIIIIPTSSPTMGVTIGASYISLPGKKISESGYGWSMTIEYEAADLISIFAGPQIGKELGLYFLPAVSANFDEGENRFGLDLGGGFLTPLGSGKMKLNISAKYSITNIIGKEDGESTASIIRILAGLNF